MYPDRAVTVTPAGRGLFVSGIVLGLSLGFAAGHLLLFARKGQDTAVAAAVEFPPFEPIPLPRTTPTFPDPGSDVAFSVMEFGDEHEIGRVTLSDEAPGDGLHFFPDSIAPRDSRPAETFLAAGDRLVAASPVRVTAELEPDPTAEPLPAPTDTAAVPQPLQPAPSAAPIDTKTSQREQAARAIIAEELPEATAQEHDIWCDVLQGLPAEDIRGILRMKKHIGASRPAAPNTPPIPPVLAEPSSPARRTPYTSSAPATSGDQSASQAARQPTVEALGQQLQTLERHNQENARTVAFKRLVPITVEANPDSGEGIRLIKVHRDMTQGALMSTGRLLDIAIEGDGFLQVRRGDEVRFTRDGRLELDDEGHLKLQAATDDWRLDPPIRVPLEATALTISPDGTLQTSGPDAQDVTTLGRVSLVQFLVPEALTSRAGGLYEADPTAGQPRLIHADGTSGLAIRQRHLEASNVTPTSDRSPVMSESVDGQADRNQQPRR